MYQGTRSQTHNRQTHHLTNLISPMTEIGPNLETIMNLIWPMIAITENLKARNAIKRKLSETQETGLVRLIVK